VAVSFVCWGIHNRVLVLWLQDLWASSCHIVVRTDFSKISCSLWQISFAFFKKNWPIPPPKKNIYTKNKCNKTRVIWPEIKRKYHWKHWGVTHSSWIPLCKSNFVNPCLIREVYFFGLFFLYHYFPKSQPPIQWVTRISRG